MYISQPVSEKCEVKCPLSPTNNLNLRLETEPITVGAAATVPIFLVSAGQIYQKPD